MDDKLNALEKRIQAAQAGRQLSEEELRRIKRTHENKASMQAGYEFVGSVLISAVVGYFLDQWLDTSPLFLILLFLLGTAAGFLSLYRLSKNLGMSVGYSQLHKAQKDAKNAPEDTTNKEEE